MNRYIEQLLEDFKESARRVPEPSHRIKSFNRSDEGEMEDFAYVETYIYGEKKQLSEIVSIPKENFPPRGKLNSEQVENLLNGILELLEAYFFFPDFPENLPKAIQYQTIVKHWNDKHIFVGASKTHIEYCDGNQEECPFPAHCTTCNDLERESQENKKKKKLEEPLISLLPNKSEIENFIKQQRQQKIKDIIQEQKKQNTIESIYNYCDRWCEECRFRNNCLLSLMEEEFYEKNIFSDKSENMLEAFDDMLNASVQMLAEMGIDNATIISPENASEDIQLDLKSHPLFKETQKYMKLLNAWLHPKTKKALCSIGSEFESNTMEYLKPLTLLGHYSVLVHTKTNRALNSLLNSNISEACIFDMNATARLILDCTTKSKKNLVSILNAEKNSNDELIPLLGSLEKTEKLIESNFPKARTFIRPGLDE